MDTHKPWHAHPQAIRHTNHGHKTTRGHIHKTQIIDTHAQIMDTNTNHGYTQKTMALTHKVWTITRAVSRYDSSRRLVISRTNSLKRRCRLSDLLGFLNCRKAFLLRGTAFDVNCAGCEYPSHALTLQRTAGDPHTHALMAEQSISLDGADGVNPGAPNANVEGGDHVGEVVAIIGPRTTLASARDPETVLYGVKHEQRRSKPLRSNNPL